MCSGDYSFANKNAWSHRNFYVGSTYANSYINECTQTFFNSCATNTWTDFSIGIDSLGVIANINSGKTGTNTHFDVALPPNYQVGTNASTFVIFPASGEIVEHYLVDRGKAGECITVKPSPPIQGIDDLIFGMGCLQHLYSL